MELCANEFSRFLWIFIDLLANVFRFCLSVSVSVSKTSILQTRTDTDNVQNTIGARISILCKPECIQIFVKLNLLILK